MYYFYMGSVLLPIPPEKLSMKIGNANKTLTLINEGEINILKEAKLTSLSFKVLIPTVQYSFATYEDGFKPPKHYLDHFESLKTSKEPFQFIVSREMPDGKLLFGNDITVSLEDYTIEENSKEGFDLVVSITLKQYREYGTKIVKVIENTVSVTTQREQSNSPAPKQETTYTVQSGDCLWNIAKKFYGNGALYTKIYETNKDKIKSPNLIYPGQVLVIPDASTINTTASTSNAVTASSTESSYDQFGNSDNRLLYEYKKLLTVKCAAQVAGYGGEISVMYTKSNPTVTTVERINSSTKELQVLKDTEVTFTVKPKMGSGCVIEITAPNSTKILTSYYTKKYGTHNTYKITLRDDRVATVRWTKV